MAEIDELGDSHPPGFIASRPVPGLLHANSESRGEGSKVYLSTISFGPGLNGKPIIFNAVDDFIYMQEHTLEVLLEFTNRCQYDPFPGSLDGKQERNLLI